MELKKGMWVITNDRMKLGQIKDFCTCDMCKERGFYEPIINNHIYINNYDKSRGFHGYKFYDNLIDLVKKGDYVNGSKVENIIESGVCDDEEITYRKILLEKGRILVNDEINNIVTKEQFEEIRIYVERND